MKWTDVKAGLVNGAFQRLMVGLGEDADTVINLINNEPTFVGRLVWFAKKGGKPYTLYKKAREIMGGNFFGVEEAIKHFGISVSNHQFATLAEIPWSAETLMACQGTHILVAVFPLTIPEIRRKAVHLFSDQASDYEHITVCDEVSWKLVRKTPVDDSTEKTLNEQLILLGGDEEVPRAQVMVFTVIGHLLATKERLFEKVYVRCADRYGHNDRFNVGVGLFGDGGLVINGWPVDGKVCFFAISSSKKM